MKITKDDFIKTLKFLIHEFEQESEELSEMVTRWKEHDDPCSDPGLQHEQELKKEEKFNDIVYYIKSNLSS